MIQVIPNYESAGSLTSCVHDDDLHPEIPLIFRDKKKNPITLYKHQREAIQKANKNRSFVVTTGTGSGKSLTYLIPIFNSILKGDQSPKVRAIIVYPMNALVNSQFSTLKEYQRNYEEDTGKKFPIRFERYTGQESDEVRRKLQNDPPHIILTNYVMLELMLVRPEERVFVEAATSHIEYLVFDELHTYRGRQGADVAFLIRRLSSRSGNKNLKCIGTSATMVSGQGTTSLDRRTAVAGFASSMFGVPIDADDVIEETLQRLTISDGIPSDADLARAFEEPMPSDVSSLIKDPLFAWVELTFGIRQDGDGKYIRNIPISLIEGAERLSLATGYPVEACKSKLYEVFITGSSARNVHEKPLIAFKIHQFFSQGGSLFGTIESAPDREFSLDRKYYAGERCSKVLFPLRFCRVCGQEYYTVRKDERKKKFIPYDESTSPADDDAGSVGYLMLQEEGSGTTWDTDTLPVEWTDKKGKIEKNYRSYVPVSYLVKPDGSFIEGSQADAESGYVRVWFEPRPFLLCMSCGEYYVRNRGSEFRKLASLATEGRSTTTTVLTLSCYKNAPIVPITGKKRKILSFTDNRQDASLQAGHFNDFVEISYLRGALFKALEKKDTLYYDTVAETVFDEMGLSLPDYARNKQLMEGSFQSDDVKRAFIEIIAYRLYIDLERGWRVVQPNLEQCGLLQFQYRGLYELVNKPELWIYCPEKFARADPEKKIRVLRTILNTMRKKLAIDAMPLDPNHQDRIERQAGHLLDERWISDYTKEIRISSSYFLYPGQTYSDKNRSIFSLSNRSLVGRYLKRTFGFTSEEYDQCICSIISVLERDGILIRHTIRGADLLQIAASCLVWQKGEGVVEPDDLYSMKVSGEQFDQIQTRQPNSYFSEFYQHEAYDLHTVEGREHTAQISYEQRIEREKAFIEGKLTCMFCSPTMELGVDISDLQLVHCRNVPPTPANYAQRSGRAGRGEDPAMVLTYCASGSAHDQFFFRHRDQLVAGVVRPPTIDLSNEDLVKAHVHAMWLGFIGLSLGKSIIDLIDPVSGQDLLALNVNVKNQIVLPDYKINQLAHEINNILKTCMSDSAKPEWYSETWTLQVLLETARLFDAAFDRWRVLYRAALEQMNLAHVHMQSHAVAKQDQAKWKQLYNEALRQIDILKNQSSNKNESDFYPYRYLAAEGFLPGYNFPTLPIRAFVTEGGDKGEYITRPRFLALTEFGPHTFLYHEGTKYQVQRLIVPPGGLSQRQSTAKICKVCGYYHGTIQADVCEYCGSQLDASQSEVLSLLEMTDVVATRRERITSDEEERDRRGYEVTTHFNLGQKDGEDRRSRIVHSIVYDEAGNEMFRLTYGQAATLLRINHGWRSGQSKSFYVDMQRGSIVSAAMYEKAQNSATQGGTINASTIEPVRLMTHDTVNLLLVEYIGDLSKWTLNVQATMQYAIKLGCEEEFQVDENELVTERIGSHERSILLFWEDSQGGLGILNQLARDLKAFAQVCSKALERCHFNPKTGEDLAPDSCPAACYECLLSYRNQPDYPLINRHDAVDLLSSAINGHTEQLSEGRTRQEQYEMLLSLCDPKSALETRFIEQLYQMGRKLPDFAQMSLKDAQVRPDFFMYPNICIFCDGSIHARPDKAEQDTMQRQELKRLGYRIIEIVDLLSGDPADRRSKEEKDAAVRLAIENKDYAHVFPIVVC